VDKHDLIKDLFVRGRRLAMDGRIQDAETVLKEALRLSRGLGTAAESRACGNLGTLYGIHGRNFEALLLYRRALAIDREREDWRLVVLHLANIAAIYVQLDLHARATDAIDELDATLPHIADDPTARQRAEDSALWVKVESAPWLGGVTNARTLLSRIREISRNDDDPRVHATVRRLDAALHREAGNHEAALGLLDEALRIEDLDPSTRLDLLLERVQALEALDRPDEARSVAIHALEGLESVAGNAQLAADSVQAGAWLAAWFEHGDDASAYAHRAYDLAASATMERIRQLDAALGDLPELSSATTEDHTWFAELRDHYAHEQRALLERVVTVLEEARRQGRSPLHAVDGDDGLIRLCAWCCTVRTAEGHWIPVAHFIPSEPRVRVTHSICPACARRLRAPTRGDPGASERDP